MTHFWPDYTSLIAELRAICLSATRLANPADVTQAMHRAADALEAERRVRMEEYAIAKHLRVQQSAEYAAREEAEAALLTAREMLKELADELAAWVDNHYALTKDHPAMNRRYLRDIEAVERARSFLAKAEEP